MLNGIETVEPLPTLSPSRVQCSELGSRPDPPVSVAAAVNVAVEPTTATCGPLIATFGGVLSGGGLLTS